MNIFIYIFISFVISATLIPCIIVLCKRNSWYDSTNERKIHSGLVPRLGSIGFVSAFIITTILYYILNKNIRFFDIFPIALAGFIIFIFGIIDDFKDLPAKFKLLIQIISSLIMVLSGYRFTQIGNIQLGWFGYVLSFVWFIGVINAFNLIDGIDALCGGLSFFITITLGIIFTVANSPSPATLSFILAAAILGFLLYNKPKAKIFMGDGGSQFLGFMIAAFSLYPTNESIEYNKFLMAALLSAIPIFDTLAAIWRRTREHRSFFSPDKAHLHHKLMNLHYSTLGILFFLYALQLGLCGIVILALWCEGLKGCILLCGGFTAMILFFAVIHYTNRAIINKYKNKIENDSN